MTKRIITSHLSHLVWRGYSIIHTTPHISCDLMLTSHLLSISNNDKALSINPNNGDALTNKGLSIYNLGNKTDAISYFVKALQIDP
jgi:tetratricopeptide (TPR) repeat protein